MTRNKPWRGESSPTAASADTRTRAPPAAQHNASVSQLVQDQTSRLEGLAHDITSSRVDVDSVDQGVTAESSHAASASNAKNASIDAQGPRSQAEVVTDHTARLTYIPPTVADEGSEEVLHIHHPEAVDDKADLKGPQESAPSPTDHEREDTHDDHLGNEDPLAVLDNFLSGAGSNHRANPFGFLDVIGDAFIGAFPGAFPGEGRSRQQQLSSAEQNYEPPRATSPARGNFHASSASITLDQQRYLVAQCRDVRGVACKSRLDLNDCLSNDNGHFRWAKGGNFKASARKVQLTHGGETLQAELREQNGRWRSASIRLPQRVSNHNGQLVLVT